MTGPLQSQWAFLKKEHDMKLLIASDLHGSSLYTQKLMEAYDREEADALLLLGDLLYHGPRNDLPEGHGPKAVIPLLNERADEILCVRGNCDAEVDQMVLDFPVMSDYLLLEADGQPVFATHGHLFSPEDPPKMKPGTLFLSGHTHIPAFRRHGRFVSANPGSVSIPKGGSEGGYLLLDHGTLFFKTLDGTLYREERIAES